MLRGLLAELGLSGEDVLLGRLQAVWAELLPSRVRAWPVALRGGKLEVVAATSAWAQELSLLAPRLCARLRERVPEAPISGLRVRVGDPPRLPASVRRVPLPSSSSEFPSPPLPPELERAIDSIEDEDLRDRLRAAVAASPVSGPRWEL